MKQWAASVVTTVMLRLGGWCDEVGRPDWFAIFEATHWPPPGRKRISQREVAQHFGVTRDQVRYALEQAQERFVELLREELLDQVAAGNDLDTEVKELQALVG